MVERRSARRLLGAGTREARWWTFRRFSPSVRGALAVMSREHLRYTVNIAERCRVVYLDNPKAGCTSIKASLAGLELACDPAEIDHKLLHGVVRSPLRRLDDFNVRDPIAHLHDEGYFFFTLVRNPFTRLASAYESKIAGNTRHKAPVLEYLGHDPSDLRRPVSFADFVEYVVGLDDLGADPHWRSQSSQVLHGIVPLDFVGRFEDFDESFQRVLDHVDQAAMSAVPMLPRRNVALGGRNVADMFDDKLRPLVVNRYHKDFENFGYPATLG